MIQGVFLFSVFMANPRVYNLYAQLYTRVREGHKLKLEVRYINTYEYILKYFTLFYIF